MSSVATEGLEIYLVGGAVRDRLLNLPVDEVPLRGRRRQSGCHARAGFQAGRQRLSGVPAPPQQGRVRPGPQPRAQDRAGLSRLLDEFTRHPDVTLEQDLERRDLTINALAQTPDGDIIDPYGGLADLDRRLLRHVSPAFAEDPVNPGAWPVSRRVMPGSVSLSQTTPWR